MIESWTRATPLSYADSKSLTNSSKPYVPVCNIWDFGFHDQMDYISIYQSVRQCPGHIGYLLADKISHYLFVWFCS